MTTNNIQLTLTTPEAMELVTALQHALHVVGWPGHPYRVLSRILKRLPGREELLEAIAEAEKEARWQATPKRVAGAHDSGIGH